ncbi:MAG: alcohol dehydrogenase catalytic domain-containing protein, partial [Acidimicrobiales bacterium]
MKAAVLQNTGDTELDIRDDVEVSDPGPGEVKIDIKATGICHSDLSGMNGTLPQPAPAVMGHEGSGVISAVGDGVEHLAEGDHVIVAWSPPCGQCVYCVDHKSPNLCADVQITMAVTPHFSIGGEPVYGFAGAGTFAESLVVPHQAAIKIPEDVPFEVGSLI